MLGLIFLRFAEVRFSARRAVLEKAETSGRRASRIDDPTAYHAEGVIYLSAKARFATLLNLPEGADVGKPRPRRRGGGLNWIVPGGGCPEKGWTFI